MRIDEPKREAIVAALGAPKATDEVEIQGHGRIEVLYYDPDLLQSRIVEEGKQAAARLFPAFACPR